MHTNRSIIGTLSIQLSTCLVLSCSDPIAHGTDSGADNYQCVVEKGTSGSGTDKVIFLGLSVKSSSELSVTSMKVRYGHGPDNVTGTPPMMVKLTSAKGTVLKTYTISDIRYQLNFCQPCPPGKSCPPCPPCKFLADTNKTIILSHAAGARYLDINEAKSFTSSCKVDYQFAGRHLLHLDMKSCLDRFCSKVAQDKDPDCK